MLLCACCGDPINVEADETTERCARIERGDFGVSEDVDRNEDNVKFSRYVCTKCFLSDPDLCAFFNKIGCRVR